MCCFLQVGDSAAIFNKKVKISIALSHSGLHVTWNHRLLSEHLSGGLLCCWTHAHVGFGFQMRTELYFLSSQKNRPSLFGMPLIVPCTVHTSRKDLYDAVWIQVSRLASPLPPQEASNHAQDWYASSLWESP